ncbi:ATP-grasp domain-containing protein [Providencia rettgeri]|uniref:ATP-grasp domain-containing protein n=1 Tax=Providencia rettgeri TaxID=587 RepID=UPI0011838BAC|nr:ATP-grasp domain-containing protein [Providencia rettgeri]
MNGEWTKPVIQKVSDIINKLGLDWGPVHVDSIINEHGYHIIEINPRIAGSFICQLVHDAYQFDIVTALLNKLSDKPYCIPAKMQLSALAYVNFILLSDPITWEITETSLLENEQINVICGQQYSQERNRRAFIYTLLKHDGRAKDLT